MTKMPVTLNFPKYAHTFTASVVKIWKANRCNKSIPSQNTNDLEQIFAQSKVIAQNLSKFNIYNGSLDFPMGVIFAFAARESYIRQQLLYIIPSGEL